MTLMCCDRLREETKKRYKVILNCLRLIMATNKQHRSLSVYQQRSSLSKCIRNMAASYPIARSPNLRAAPSSLFPPFSFFSTEPSLPLLSSSFHPLIPLSHPIPSVCDRAESPCICAPLPRAAVAITKGRVVTDRPHSPYPSSLFLLLLSLSLPLSLSLHFWHIL